MLEQLKAIIAEYSEINPDEITTDTVLRTEIGLDSLQLANLVVAIEEAFDVEISERDALTFQTIGDVIAFIGSAEK